MACKFLLWLYLHGPTASEKCNNDDHDTDDDKDGGGGAVDGHGKVAARPPLDQLGQVLAVRQGKHWKSQNYYSDQLQEKNTTKSD